MSIERASSSTTVRILAALRAIADATARDSSLHVAEAAAQLGIPRPTMHRILQSFVQHGMAEPDPDNRSAYMAGPDLYEMAAMLHMSDPLPTLAKIALRHLSDEISETTQLALYHHNRTISWAFREFGTNALGYSTVIGQQVSPLWGCSGQCVMAHLPKAEVDAILDRDSGVRSPMTDELPNLRQLRQGLTTIRHQGWAQSLGQRAPNAFGLAAPVFTRGGAVIGALSVSMPEMRVRADTQETLTPRVVEAAAALTRQLGGHNHGSHRPAAQPDVVFDYRNGAPCSE